MRFRYFRTTRERTTCWVVQDSKTGRELWLTNVGGASGARNTCDILNDPGHVRHQSLMDWMLDTMREPGPGAESTPNTQTP